MKPFTSPAVIGFLALAAAVLFQLAPRTGGEAHATVMKSYLPFAQQTIHRRGCLDPTSRGLNADVDVVRLSVEEETTMRVSLRGRDGLEPGFVVTADEGAAATQSWMRELGSKSGDGLSALVVLPTAGSYSFVIADRRELTGDEMAAGQGCFDVDFRPAPQPEPQPMPYVWRGTVGVPTAFTVPRRGRDLTLVEVTHAGGEGVLLVSVFEDNQYVHSLTIGKRHDARVLVSSRHESARVLIEEAANWGREPLRAMVRPVPSAIAPDATPAPSSERFTFNSELVQ